MTNLARIPIVIFISSCASLAFEVTLTRVFSITLWYHFAFMVISIAMLGFAASGTALSLFPRLGKTGNLALYALLVYVAVQFIEGHLVIPLAQKWAVSMPPALALVAIVPFGVVFGLPGVLFALPLAVVTMVMVQKLYVDRL